MKKLLVLSLFLGFLTMNAIAQDHKMDKSEWHKKVKDELKLTPEQVTKYDALTTEYDPKFDAIKNNSSLTKDQMKEQKMALMKEKDVKLNEFLTPEQQTKYKEMIEKKMKDMKDHKQ
ncbi:hypothetical protein [Flavihumibacter petaseus]|uniref:LTXXQ motif family protein n=1 Tax=Flavihumibacter petaseus NBRC 106054 TaxID=1220578 RepID=A0A0E9MZP7_9BACT|nr:hypothetical protein [Flavihumibacter petaseus]GAO43232.1 hypothetical protein FPE01S_02_03360 [Flavihumibacter petaseus NBRC 106054]